MSSATATISVSNAGRLQRVKTSKVPRQRWHSWHLRQFRICKLQILKETRETESLSLRQIDSWFLIVTGAVKPQGQ